MDIGFVSDPEAQKDTKCNWSQILVPGELKSNPSADKAPEAWLDLGRYAREVLAAQDTRRFVLGFTICAERNKRTVNEYHEYYFYHRPTWDIEAQARGEMEEEYEEPAIDLAIAERARLAEIFYCQPEDWTDEEILHHRIESINLMVALCDKRDGQRQRD